MGCDSSGCWRRAGGATSAGVGVVVELMLGVVVGACVGLTMCQADGVGAGRAVEGRDMRLA